MGVYILYPVSLQGSKLLTLVAAKVKFTDHNSMSSIHIDTVSDKSNTVKLASKRTGDGGRDGDAVVLYVAAPASGAVVVRWQMSLIHPAVLQQHREVGGHMYDCLL